MTTIYESNQVMQVIGKQPAGEFMGGGTVGYSDFLQVLEAHRQAEGPANDIFSIGVDFFALGMIYGRKAERARRNNGDIKPITTD